MAMEKMQYLSSADNFFDVFNLHLKFCDTIREQIVLAYFIRELCEFTVQIIDLCIRDSLRRNEIILDLSVC